MIIYKNNDQHIITRMMLDRSNDHQLSWILIVTAVLGWRLVNTAAVQVLVITCDIHNYENLKRTFLPIKIDKICTAQL